MAQPCLRAQDAAPNPGQMMLVPSRVVLEGEERSTALTLFNRGSAEASYELALQHFDMDEGGRLHEFHPDNAALLEEMVVVAPMRATLRPGESQVFRILLRKPAGLPAGEYRVHLTFRTRTAREEGTASSAAPAGQIQVQTRPGISVPVIIRHGTQAARASIRDLAPLRGKRPGLSLKLCRSGAQSIFGDLTVVLVDAQGALRPITAVQGIAVYPSLACRIVEIPYPDAPPPPGSRLRVLFAAKDQEGQAEGELTLPGS